MTDVAYPIVYAALFAVSGTALTCRVTDGYDVSDDPADVLMLGVPNLADTSAIAAGNYTQEQMGHGTSGVVKETGSISGLVMTWNGEASDAGALAARTAAFGYLDLLGAAVRADRSIGVTAFSLAVQTVTATGDIAEDKVDGATCAVSFTVNYTAHIEH